MGFIGEIQDTEIQDKETAVTSRLFAYLVSRILYLCIFSKPKFKILKTKKDRPKQSFLHDLSHQAKVTDFAHSIISGFLAS